jgi:nicotinamidase-related amidase
MKLDLSMDGCSMKTHLTLKGRYLRSREQLFEPLELSIPRTVFLLVDIYYDDQIRGDWGDPSNPFMWHFEKMENSISVALAAARQAGMQVIYAMNSSPRIGLQKSAFGYHFARCWSTDGSPETFNREFAEGGVDSREYHSGPDMPLKIPPKLMPQEGDLYIRKHVYSAFFDSRLDTALRNLGVDTLVCSGLWTNVCMAATALDALYRNYRVIWLRDGTLAGEGPRDDPTTLPNTKRWVAWFEEIIGFTVTSDEFVQACWEIPS